MKLHSFWPFTQSSIFAFPSKSFISDSLLDCWKLLCIHNTNLSWSEKATRYTTRRTNRKRPISAFFLQITSKYLWQGLTLIPRQRSQYGSLNWRQLSNFYSSQSDSSELFVFTGSERNTTVHSAAEKKIPLTLSSFKVMQIWSKTKKAWIVGVAYPYSSPSISNITENWAHSNWNKNKLSL